MINIAKIGLLVFWFAWVATLAGLIGAQAGMILTWLGALIALAHVVEVVIFRATLRAKPESFPMAVLLTLVFGVFYIRDGRTA